MPLALALAFAAAPLAAQLRSIPADAKRGTLSHVREMEVLLDGRPARLAPGAQIRDGENRIVLPMQLPPDSLVKYQLDGEGLLRRVWILTPAEAAQPDPRR
ncbi:MAG: hypothetical protein N2653_09080 [Burkholderiales bacterium]|nr:hypothetical protein [Burkholderiales bacterium]